MPRPALLNHDALITIASVPAARGDDITAYALLPETVWQIFTTNWLLNKKKTHSFTGTESIILYGSSKAKFTEFSPKKFRSSVDNLSQGG